MEITKPDEAYLDTDKLRAELEVFLAQPLPRESPPCPNCGHHKPLQCSAKCTDAAKALSIDPDNYPIETNVSPLVFELMASKVFQTCWSCEGHLNDNNDIWKLPNVSFYAKSSNYTHLLVRHIKNLQLERRLKYPWQVVLTDYAQTWGTTYCIQPDLTREQDIHLGMLQNDIKSIAENMLEKLRIIARQCLQDLH